MPKNTKSASKTSMEVSFQILPGHARALLVAACVWTVNVAVPLTAARLSVTCWLIVHVGRSIAPGGYEVTEHRNVTVPEYPSGELIPTVDVPDSPLTTVTGVAVNENEWFGTANIQISFRVPFMRIGGLGGRAPPKSQMSSL